jgi:tripartite-type tricarboxylate transporter receptor subunit TctC
MEYAAKMPADGYQLYYADNGPLTIAPHLQKVNYDYLKSFTHLGHVCGSGSMLVVHQSTPFYSMNDVITLSKKDPNKWSYGTSGVGGPHHLSGEYFKSVTGAKLLHVPYKGGGPAMTDLMGGQVPMLFSSLGPIVGAVKSGKIRPLAVTSLKRSAAFPDVPTKDDKQFRDSINATGCDAEILTPAQTVEKIKNDYAKWGKVVREANIKAE